jgi:tetratricopeptide (TPR) repeat protein
LIKSIGGYWMYRITNEDRFPVCDEVVGVSRGRFLNWLLSPVELDDAFFEDVRAWTQSIVECTTEMSLSHRIRHEAMPKSAEWLVQTAHNARKAGDFSAATGFFSEAVRKGAHTAHYWLGKIAEDQEQYDKALRHYRAGAELRVIAAMRGVARAYQLGHGVEVDLDQARQWFERAADLGDRSAVAARLALD